MYLYLLLYVTVLYVRPAEIVPALDRVPIVDIVTLAGIPIAALSMAMRPRRLIVTPTDVCVLGFWAAIVVSNLAWGWFGGALAGFLNFMPVVFCYILIRLALQTPRQFRWFIYLLVVLNLFQALNGIVQYHTGVGLGGVETVGGEEHRIRGTGIFHDPNDLGMTLVMTTPFIVAAIFAAGTAVWKRLVWLLVLAPFALAMYYTSSRGTVMGLGIVLVAFGYRRFRSVLGAAVAGVAVAGIILLGPARARAMDAGESSAQSRVEAWGEGLGMLKANPVFGVGYSRFTEFHRKVAHNSIVHTFSELGLVGEFFLVGAFYGFFRALGVLRRSGDGVDGHHEATRDAIYWARGLSLSALGALVCGYFLSRQYVVVPYILLAMGVSRATMSADGPGSFWRQFPQQVVTTGALTLAGVVVVWISVRTLGAW